MTSRPQTELKRGPAIALAALCLFTCPATRGNAAALLPQVGITKAVGEGTDDVRVGFSAGGDVLLAITPRLAAGFHAAFTYFPVDGELPDFIYSGSIEVVEIGPVLRLSTTRASGADFFGQVGLGAYLASVTIHGDLLGEPVEGKDETTDLGLQIGAGVVFGEGRTKFEIAPLFHLVFSEEETTKYFVFRAGLVIHTR